MSKTHTSISVTFCHSSGGANLLSLSVTRQVARMIMAVALSFIVCWTPFYVINIISQLQRTSFLNDSNFLFTMLVTRLLGVVSSALNPLVYYCMSHKFRRSFRAIISDLLCCTSANHERNLLWANHDCDSRRKSCQRKQQSKCFAERNDKATEMRPSCSRRQTTRGKSSDYSSVRHCGVVNDAKRKSGRMRRRAQAAANRKHFCWSPIDCCRQRSALMTSSSREATNSSAHDQNLVLATSAATLLNAAPGKHERDNNQCTSVTVTLHMTTVEKDKSKVAKQALGQLSSWRAEEQDETSQLRQPRCAITSSSMSQLQAITRVNTSHHATPHSVSDTNITTERHLSDHSEHCFDSVIVTSNALLQRAMCSRQPINRHSNAHEEESTHSFQRVHSKPCSA